MKRFTTQALLVTFCILIAASFQLLRVSIARFKIEESFGHEGRILVKLDQNKTVPLGDAPVAVTSYLRILPKELEAWLSTGFQLNPKLLIRSQRSFSTPFNGGWLESKSHFMFYEVDSVVEQISRPDRSIREKIKDFFFILGAKIAIVRQRGCQWLGLKFGYKSRWIQWIYLGATPKQERRSDEQWLRTLGYVHLFSLSGVFFWSLRNWVARFVRFIPIHLSCSLPYGLGSILSLLLWIFAGGDLGPLRGLGLMSIRFFLPHLNGLQATGGLSTIELIFWLANLLVSSRLAEVQLPSLFEAVGAAHFYLSAGSFYWSLQKRKSTHGVAVLYSGSVLLFFQAILNHPVAPLGLLFGFLSSGLLIGVGLPLLLSALVLNDNQALSAVVTLYDTVLSHSIPFATEFLWTANPTWTFAVLFACFLRMVRSTATRLRYFSIGEICDWAAVALFFLILIVTWPSKIRVGLEGAIQVQQLDVGQGDSALVLSEQGAGLIDTGSARALTAYDWFKILSHELKVPRLDWVFLTHLDEDHSGGLLNLMKIINVECIQTDRSQWVSARGKKFIQAVMQISQGKTRLVDHEQGCVPHRVLKPSIFRWSRSENRLGSQGSQLLSNSGMSGIVVELGNTKNMGHGARTYLNFGDAGGDQELEWVKGLLLKKGELVFKLSHHGSKTSSPLELFKQIQPNRIWVSVGTSNRYGHPSPEVMTRLLQVAPFAASVATPAIEQTSLSGKLSFDSK